ncbi:MAG: BlaI/MecI/CopY family transcriptional regulator [Cellvibrionaceae bacterium]|nr:BlaI/MecI/CopY family transcriptional regulator [Cellvibrionaceae bacterium]MCV6627248.1 BlaI/MecI/CopY family transcriptional regulator [Cellvibrionaceae bacterium]
MGHGCKTDKGSVLVQAFDKFIQQYLGRRPGPGAMPQLGPREIEVLKVLWRSDTALPAQAVLAELAQQGLSLSTVQSTLERLNRKGLLRRSKVSRAYHYRAAVAQSAVIGCLLSDISSQISDGQLAPMISGFMDFVCQHSQDPQNLKQMMQDALEQGLEQDD